MQQKYGYIRVSSKDQNIDRQILALQEYGIQRDKLFIDKLSGKDFDRPQYCRLIEKKRITPAHGMGRRFERLL